MVVARSIVISALLATSQAAHVVVVGGGFAGLGAATELEKAGHTVTLLEAKGHLGGRAWTDSSQFGYPVDMGAMWIHGITKNPVYALAEQYGLKMTSTDYDNLKVFAPNGSEVDDARIESLWSTFASKLDKNRNKADPDVSLGVSMEKTFKNLKLSKEEQDLMRFKICDEIELDIAATVYNVSGYWYDADDYLKGGDVLITDSRGYAGLVEQIAVGLKDVRLNTPVHKVDYSDSSSVAVHTSDGVINADYTVVTVSLGVLKTDLIDFAPALPSKIQKAIDRLGCDVSDKVVLEFPEGTAEQWGGAEKDVFYILNQEPGRHGEFVETWNMKHYTGRDMLMSFSVGPRDWALIEDAPGDDAVGQAALAQMRVAFPGLPEPLQVHVHRWGLDPYAQCTWSSWYLGSKHHTRADFLSSAGRLLFAGEHVDESHPGTTHGAWNTGASAAAAVTVAETQGFGAASIAALRTEMQKPQAEDVFEGRPLHSRRKEWSRMQRGKITVV